MKTKLIVLTTLISLQVTAFPLQDQFFKLLKDTITMLTNAHASMAAQGGNQTHQKPAGPSRPSNSPAATPPAPTATESSNSNYFDQRKLEDFLKFELKKASRAMKNNNCGNKNYIDDECFKIFCQKTESWELYQKLIQEKLSPQEISDIKSNLIKKIYSLKTVINKSNELCAELKKSSYINGEYLEGSRETLFQQNQFLNELAYYRQALKDIFGTSI